MANSKVETTQQPDAEAWSLAKLYADGDVRRLEVSKDGRTVIVRNQPR